MDGDKADISEIDKILSQTDAILMQDDAHGFGIFDPTIPQAFYLHGDARKSCWSYGCFCSWR